MEILVEGGIPAGMELVVVSGDYPIDLLGLTTRNAGSMASAPESSAQQAVSGAPTRMVMKTEPTAHIVSALGDVLATNNRGIVEILNAAKPTNAGVLENVIGLLKDNPLPAPTEPETFGLTEEPIAAAPPAPEVPVTPEAAAPAAPAAEPEQTPLIQPAVPETTDGPGIDRALRQADTQQETARRAERETRRAEPVRIETIDPPADQIAEVQPKPMTNEQRLENIHANAADWGVEADADDIRRLTVRKTTPQEIRRHFRIKRIKLRLRQACADLGILARNGEDIAAAILDSGNENDVLAITAAADAIKSGRTIREIRVYFGLVKEKPVEQRLLESIYGKSEGDVPESEAGIFDTLDDDDPLLDTEIEEEEEPEVPEAQTETEVVAEAASEVQVEATVETTETQPEELVTPEEQEIPAEDISPEDAQVLAEAQAAASADLTTVNVFTDEVITKLNEQGVNTVNDFKSIGIDEDGRKLLANITGLRLAVVKAIIYDRPIPADDELTLEDVEGIRNGDADKIRTKGIETPQQLYERLRKDDDGGKSLNKATKVKMVHLQEALNYLEDIYGQPAAEDTTTESAE